MAEVEQPVGPLRAGSRVATDTGTGLSVRDTLAAYRRLVGIRLRSDLQYRVSFVVSFMVSLLITGLDFVVILFLFDKVDTLGEWTLAETAYLYGIAGIAFAIADLFTGAAGSLSERIRAGSFDQLLIRPIGPLWQMSADEFNLRRFGRMTQAAAVLFLALPRLDVDWTLAKVLVTMLAIPTGAVIFGTLFVIASTVSFWFVSANEVASAFTYGGQLVAQYPADIFSSWLRRLALFVVPVAAVAYLPALFVLDVPNAAGLPTVVQLSGPLIAAVLVVAARSIWRIALRHHRSTGT